VYSIAKIADRPRRTFRRNTLRLGKPIYNLMTVFVSFLDTVWGNVYFDFLRGCCER
jgi:hypothetical protein